ncbi:MAG TPA: sigma-70 family RNA polymerase sigma factor [Pyrinomonadaceae bacterium]|jgi:RNA polymerase sigma factor (TIGR02999 family)|nr:sigma-70 family RNA polymerase sigma factor [Pyrinomonadaceae bacterium]
MPTESVTELLIAWNDGDPSALERLIPLVEGELRRLARRHMRREGPAHTLQTTALVNEVYLKLVDQTHAHWHNRAHFFSISAQIMRRILIDYARRNLRGKRGGGAAELPLEEAAILTREKSAELVALDEALKRLAELDPLKARVVELRHFGGLSVKETAEVLKISEVTVIRHWGLAKSWLRKQVRGD